MDIQYYGCYQLDLCCFTQRRTNIESTLFQRHYLESALTQCQFIAACPAKVKINTSDTYIVSDFEFTVHKRYIWIYYTSDVNSMTTPNMTNGMHSFFSCMYLFLDK